jgi:TPR repeat protein
MLVQEGMKILRSNLYDFETEKKAFELFKNAADETNNIEACWRVSACFLRSIGTTFSRTNAQHYAKKAMNGGSVDGFFWFGVSQKEKMDSLLYIQHAYEEKHISGKFWIGSNMISGAGRIKKDEQRGKSILKEVFESGDRFWTVLHGYYCEKGLNAFKKNEVQAKKLYELSKNQHLSDCTVFMAVVSQIKEIKANFC